MIIAFITVSVVFGMFISYIWSSNGATNVLIKMAFSFYTLFGIFMLFMALAPMINESGMKLF